MKQATFFISKTKQIYAKTLAVPESAPKIKVMLPWILFKFCLCQQLFCKHRCCLCQIAKRGCAKLSKLQTPRRYSRSF